MSFRLLPGVLAFVAVVPAQAFAHAALKRAEPAAGETVKVAPGAVTLEFSEGVVARLSEITVRDAAGKLVQAAHAEGTGKALSATLGSKLGPGTYTVTWRAVSVDSHRTQGKFTFTVAP